MIQSPARYYLSALIAGVALAVGFAGCGGNHSSSTVSVSGPSTTFSSAGTFSYTVPVGVTSLRAQVWAGGGGGGAYAGPREGSPGLSAGGGGGGGYSEAVVPVSPNQVISVSVGAGGIQFLAGSNSSFGSAVVANGGVGGTGNGGLGGLGGHGTTFSGQNGSAGGVGGIGGIGGTAGGPSGWSSPAGVGGVAGTAGGSGGNGGSPGGCGGGAGGGVWGQPPIGGVGGAGMVIVTPQ